MDRVVDLEAILRHEVSEYVWDEADSKAYFMQDAAHRVYSVLLVPHENTQDSVTIIVARLTNDDRIVIDTDLTDKPLYDALIQAGVPRERIVRAYAGERVALP
ncbi:MAG: element excision factor XisI family protein [Anaerolineae bacterium]